MAFKMICALRICEGKQCGHASRRPGSRPGIWSKRVAWLGSPKGRAAAGDGERAQDLICDCSPKNAVNGWESWLQLFFSLVRWELTPRPQCSPGGASAAGRRRRSGPGEGVESEAAHTSPPPVDHGGKKLTGRAITSSSPLLNQSPLSEKWQGWDCKRMEGLAL